MSIIVKTEGRRTYFTGSTYEHRETFKYQGATWDKSKKAWWCGNKKAETIIRVLKKAKAIEEDEKPQREIDMSKHDLMVAVRVLLRDVGPNYWADMGRKGGNPSMRDLLEYPKSELAGFIEELESQRNC